MQPSLQNHLRSQFVARSSQALQTTQTPQGRPISPTNTPSNNIAQKSTMQRAGSLQRCQAESTTSSSNASTPAAATPFSAAALTYTSYEGNSWRAEFASTGLKVLVDPWLVGKLAFGGFESVYCGTKRVARPETIDIDRLAAETDFILLTMSIDDHAHRPTLERLPKSIPVVGSPSAAAVARKLGYTTVYGVDHGQEVTVCDGKMKIRATQGALVGPPWSKRENGYVLTETSSTGISMYYEPHADYVASSVAEVGTVDVVVSPPSTQSLLGYQLVKGATDNVPLLKMLRPKVIIPLMNAEFDATGPLHYLLSESGGVDLLQKQLEETPELKNVKICLPLAGAPMAVEIWEKISSF
jgi:L-ascorbate metabolism protein UlaG (beta-lactamase superfamily)